MTDLLGIPETLLPPDPAAEAIDSLTAGPDSGTAELAAVAAAYPASSLAWAELADDALDREATVEAYAYARTGYHRGLDALRRAGWRGQGPVPWSHVPNRGFLRSLGALAQAADAIGEGEERNRCTEFLRAASPEAARELGL